MRVLLCFALLALAAGYKTYQGYQVLRAYPQTKDETLFLNEQTIWEAVQTSDGVDLYVPPQYRVAARGLLSDIVFDVSIENLGDLIEVEQRRLSKKKAFDLNDFNTYEDIMAELPNYLTLCASNGLTCSITNIGNSVENRAINVLRVSSGGGSKPAVYMDSLTHSREWLAGATLLNIMDNVIRQGDADAVRLLGTYDFYFGPVMNPDGYVYTFSSERLWRKNRAVNSGTTCRGTDLNRNFAASYRRAGTSNNPCSDTYHGTGPASEVETQAIQDNLDSIPDLTAVISIHSYGRMYLHPVGYDTGNCQQAPEHAQMYAGATAAAQAIMQTGGQTWTWGTVCATIYAATGATIDYSYESAGVIYSYTPEVRGNSFIVSPGEIGPSYREMWAGTIALLDSI